MTVGPGSNAATGRIRSACLTRNSSATSPRAVRPIHAARGEDQQGEREDGGRDDPGDADRDRRGRAR